jgi:hypothetical protein
MARPAPVGSVFEEFAAADFGDARLTGRLQKVADAVAAAPSDSFPQIANSDSELEGVYRFLSNERVSPEAILAPHLRATRERTGGGDVLVVHDTTEFKFGGWVPREGLGRIRRVGGSQGFFGHFALAVAADGSRRPLGLLGLKTLVRSGPPLGRKVTGRHRMSQRRVNESERWADLALEVQGGTPNAIHVMDREADSFELFTKLASAGARFVIRIREGDNRVVEQDGDRLPMSDVVATEPVLLTRTVPLSRRVPNGTRARHKIFPPRAERTATLEVRSATVTIPRPLWHPKRRQLQRNIVLNVVLVQEVDQPSYAAPVSWMLATTEPVATAAEVERVVDAYRSRWMIEEFFKALKTGCAYEKRQLETFHALVNALAVFAVIAWRLLVLRSTARLNPDAPATDALTPEQVRVLKTLSSMKEPGVPKIDMPANATAQDALLAVARLGGHIKNNGPPGWQVLGRGYDSLLLLQTGWRARERCDR